MRRIRFFGVVVTVLLLLGTVPVTSSGAPTWLRRRPDQVGTVARAWVDTSRWETRREQVSPAIPAQYADRLVEVVPGYTIPAVTETRWVEILPARPALGVVNAVEITPGGWQDTWIPPVTETHRVRVAESVPAVYEVREETTTGHWNNTWIPPLTMPQMIMVAHPIPARYEDRVVPSSAGRWERQWIPPVTQTVLVRFEATPARYEWHVVEVDPGRWESTWIPEVTETRWVETSPAVPGQPAQWGWQTTTTPGRWSGSWGWEEDEWGNMRIVWIPFWVPEVTETRWVEISPAVPEQPAQGHWQTVVVVPGRRESRWIPPLTMGQWIQVTPALPARYESRLIESIPGRWEDVWVPTTTVSRWVQVAAAVPARYETRSVVVTPARTIPAVTERRWVQTSPAIAARAAQGSWQTVVITPARVETRRVEESLWRPETVVGWTAAPLPVTHLIFVTEPGRGGWTIITPGLWQTTVTASAVTIPAVTERRWVQTSPAVAAQAARGEYRDVVFTPARSVPAVTSLQTVRVAEAIPARYELQQVPIGTVIERVRVAEAIPARYEDHPVEVDPGRWDSVWVPPVTTTHTVRIAEAIPAVYHEQVTELVPGRWSHAWVHGTWHHFWTETSPAVPAVWGWHPVVIAPPVVVPPIMGMRRVQVAAAVPARYEDRMIRVISGHWESLRGSITVERDREYVLTRLWRPRNKKHDMTLTVTHDLNRTVTGVRAVHVLNRYQNMGLMFVSPVSVWSPAPGRTILNFNYTNPGQIDSTLYIWFDIAGGYAFEIYMDIPVNGIVVTQRRGQGPLILARALAQRGTIVVD